MKMKTFFAEVRKIIAPGIVCILLFAVVSCEASKEPYAIDETRGKREVVGGDVCPCDKEMAFFETQIFPRGEVRLFKDYVPRKFLYPCITSPIIVFYSEYNIAGLVLPASYLGLKGSGHICNFPDFAREWLNYENGIRVYIEGLMYRYSFPHLTNIAPFGYMLTSIKKR